ncbi:MAG: glycosyltransferase, partial [Deltaproteobacteria bacterium]|nr:glycosyltransferase [Deltaproteobacteria bacterium]MBW2363061.1 glycosyltransferase [Deltaproteobacteria bacterium]
MRIALLTPLLAPGRLAALRALSDTPGWRLRVLVDAESEFEHSWQVDPSHLDVETLPTLSLPRVDRTPHLTSPWSVWRALSRFRPDAVVSSELGPRSLGAWLYCRAHGIPWLAWLEPTRHRNASAGPARRLLDPALLRRAAAAIVPGREAERALREWGIPATRIFIAPNCHDVPTFEKCLASVEPDAARLALRAGLGARARIALVVGRLFPIKGIEPLL